MRPEQEVKTSGWWEAFIRPKFTFSNYDAVLSSTPGSANLTQFFFNSVKITVPAVLLSVGIGAMAAYAFSWMKFKGREWLFVAVVAMLVVPLQMALIPLLRLITGGAHIGSVTIFPYLHLNNSVAAVWVAHVCFGLPFCIFILKNFISALPREIIEAARVDGAGHLTVFTRLVVPLSVPALASLAIFQFMWIWNDLLIGLVYGGAKNKPIIAKLVEVGGTYGQSWHLLTAAAFVSMVVPLLRVLRLAAVLRPRPPGRGRQGMTAGASPEALVDQLTIDEQVSLLAGVDFWHTASVERLGIPALRVSDGPVGARGTRFDGPASLDVPCSTALAATWDPDLVERIGQLLGRETKAKGAGVLLAPTVNLHRTPIGGRNFECMSEDPYLTARIAVAYVAGLAVRGRGGVHQALRRQRHRVRADVDRLADRRAHLRELYLVPFEAAVKEAGVLAVMTAYNRINGPFAADSEPLVRGVLRGEWGFDGLVMSDWFGLHSTVEGLAPGVDLEMPGPTRFRGQALLDAVERGDVTAEQVAARRSNVLHPDGSGGGARRATGPGPELTRDDPTDRALDPRCAGAEGWCSCATSRTAAVRQRCRSPRTTLRRVAVIGPNAADRSDHGWRQRPRDADARRRIRSSAIVDRLATARGRGRPRASVAPSIDGFPSSTSVCADRSTIDYFVDPATSTGDDAVPQRTRTTGTTRIMWVDRPARSSGADPEFGARIEHHVHARRRGRVEPRRRVGRAGPTARRRRRPARQRRAADRRLVLRHRQGRAHGRRRARGRPAVPARRRGPSPPRPAWDWVASTSARRPPVAR